MKTIFAIAACLGLCLAGTSCSKKISATQLNGWEGVSAKIVSYNELTMDLDPEPVEYVIDISTADGRAKLDKLSLQEAKDLALVEAIMSAKCATIFQPQYTHVVQKGKVLGVKVYGFPARYKKKE